MLHKERTPERESGMGGAQSDRRSHETVYKAGEYKGELGEPQLMCLRGAVWRDACGELFSNPSHQHVEQKGRPLPCPITTRIANILTATQQKEGIMDGGGSRSLPFNDQAFNMYSFQQRIRKG